MAINWNLWEEGTDGADYCQSIYDLSKQLQPEIGLEIGVRFGKSALATLLGSPEMKLIGVDPNPEFDIVPFMQSQGMDKRFIFIQQSSPDALRQFPREYFDWIYIDGRHDYTGVWQDFVIAWHLLKPEGTMIFDDCDPNLGYKTDVLKMLQDWAEIITGQEFKHNIVNGNPHKAAMITK